MKSGFQLLRVLFNQTEHKQMPKDESLLYIIIDFNIIKQTKQLRNKK